MSRLAFQIVPKRGGLIGPDSEPTIPIDAAAFQAGRVCDEAKAPALEVLDHKFLISKAKSAADHPLQ